MQRSILGTASGEAMMLQSDVKELKDYLRRCAPFVGYRVDDWKSAIFALRESRNSSCTAIMEPVIVRIGHDVEIATGIQGVGSNGLATHALNVVVPSSASSNFLNDIGKAIGQVARKAQQMFSD